jgi:virulence factor Mce-like protein
MGLKAPKLSLILVAVVFALSCFGFTLFVWKSFGGPTPFQAHGYRFHIVFGSEASQMTSNADVRIAGVSVGKVISVRKQGNGADVLVEMESDYAPVPRDTRAIVRFKSLLGEAFVALTPGDRDAPELPENETLDAGNIGDVQQIDEVLGAFDAPTRLAFTQFLRDTAKVLDKRSQDVNAALGNLAPTSEAAAELLTVLDRQKGSVQTLVRDSGTVLGAISARQDDLRSLVRAGNEVFSATAAESQALTETVRAFPPFLRDTRAALSDIDAVVVEAAPTLQLLRPAVPLLRPALLETARLAPLLRRTFDGLDPVVTAAGRGLPALDAILKAAHPALKTLYVAGRELIPVADYLRRYRTDAIASIAKVAASVNFPVTTSDGSVQRILRSMFIITDETPTDRTQRLGSNRHNAYPLPGELARVGNGGIRAFHCRNVNNPQSVPVIGQPSPPCVVSPKFSFRGQLRSYPHVEIAPK